MAAPAPSWNTVRVIGTWHNLDGTMKAGKWTLTYPVRVVNTTNDAIIPAGSTTGDLQTTDATAPSLDIPVPATDDPDNTPNGWQYKLVISFTDASPKETYTLSVPLAGGDIDLANIVLTQTFTTRDVLVRGVAGGLAGLNSAGLVIDAAGDVVSGGGGTNVYTLPESTPPPVGWTGVWFVLDATSTYIVAIRTP